ncbi:MAG: ATP-binding protein, partial [Verrucomicrobiae bacterium]|nr:ATP-binding protein [Verrucomicrobiae bacterium]
MGRTAREIGMWCELEEWDKLRRMLRERGNVHGFEAKFTHKNGSVKHVILSVESLRFSMGPCLLFAALDVTERMQLEQQLRESQKAEAIGQLARGVAHDFNNILTIIHGHARLLRMHNEVSLRALDSVRQIEEATVRAANLTKQLLTFSRHHPMQPRVVNLNDVVNGVVQMLRRSIGEDIVVEFNPTEPLWPVMADVAMMEQVLVNLAINARDAMPHGGRLVISTAALESKALPPGRPRECALGPYVCLSVQDSGQGIPPQILPRIFEPFFTTKEPGKGTGLGLATVRSIVSQHKGWVDVESEVGRGSIFRVYLPAVQSACQEMRDYSPSSVMPTGKETVLVVEDEDEVRELCRDCLLYTSDAADE